MGAHLLAFIGVAALLIVIPGPDTAVLTKNVLVHGRRAGLGTAFGVGAGLSMWTLASAVGLASLVRASAVAYTALKLVGAVYLIWLGVQAIRHRKDLASAVAVPAGERRDRRAVRDGFVVGITNPKAYILFGAILPQFVSQPAGHVPAQMLLLALVSVGIGLACDNAWGLAASTVRAWFARSPGRFALVGGAGGLAMIGLGVTVAVTGRSD